MFLQSLTIFALTFILCGAQESLLPNAWDKGFAKLHSGDQAFQEQKYKQAAKEYQEALKVLDKCSEPNKLLYTELQDRYETATLLASSESPPLEPQKPSIPLKAKVREVVIPELKWSEVTLKEAIDFLRNLSITYNQESVSLEQAGVSFILHPISSDLENERFTLHLRQVSILQILKALCKVIDVKFSLGEYAIALSERSNSSEMFTKHYSLPSSKLLRNVGLDKLPKGSQKLFGEVTTCTTQQLLENLGVEFPQGSSILTIAASDTLIIKNTEAQHNYIDALIQRMNEQRGDLIKLEVRLISIQKNLENERAKEWSLAGSLTELFSAGQVYASANTTPYSSGFLYDPLNIKGGQTLNSSLIQTPLDEGITSLESYTNLLSGGLSFAAGMTSIGTELLFYGLRQSKNVKCLIKPHVIAQSGKCVSLKIGEEFRYPSQYSPAKVSSGTGGVQWDDDLGDYTWREDYSPVLERLNTLYGGETLSAHYTGAVVPSHPIQFTTTFLGTNMSLIPTYDAKSGLINLSIDFTHREFDGYINYGSPIQTVSHRVTFDRDWLSNNMDILEEDVSLQTLFQSLENSPDIETEQYIFQATENRILQPLFSKVSAQTNVSLFDGTTVLLGSLVQTNQRSVAQKSPVFSKIPFIGEFFTSNVEQRIDKQIFIAIKASMVNPQGVPLN